MNTMLNNIQTYLILSALAILSWGSVSCYTYRVWNRTGEKIQVTMNPSSGSIQTKEMAPADTYTDFSTDLCLYNMKAKGLSGAILNKESNIVSGNETGFAISCTSNFFVAERVGDQLILRRMLDPNEPFDYYTKWRDLVKLDDGSYMWAYDISKEREKWDTFQKYIYAAEYTKQLEENCKELGYCK